MTQTELNAAVAAATGESLATISAMGFSLAVENAVAMDDEPHCDPQVVDWDVPVMDRPDHLLASTFTDALATTTFA